MGATVNSHGAAMPLTVTSKPGLNPYCCLTYLCLVILGEKGVHRLPFNTTASAPTVLQARGPVYSIDSGLNSSRWADPFLPRPPPRFICWRCSAALTRATARRTWHVSWDKRKPGRSGSSASTTRRRRLWTWDWSTRSCRSRS